MLIRNKFLLVLLTCSIGSLILPTHLWSNEHPVAATPSTHIAPIKKTPPTKKPAQSTTKEAPQKIPENSLEAPILATIDKTSQYLQQETLAGGQASEDQVLVLNSIRRSIAAAGDYERLVLDFKNSRSDDVGLAPSYFSIRSRKITHKDYLQIQISGANIDTQVEESLKKTYRKPGLFSRNPQIIAFPSPAKELIILLEVNPKTKFEAFQLSNPGRIVLDLKG